MATNAVLPAAARRTKLNFDGSEKERDDLGLALVYLSRFAAVVLLVGEGYFVARGLQSFQAGSFVHATSTGLGALLGFYLSKNILPLPRLLKACAFLLTWLFVCDDFASDVLGCLQREEWVLLLYLSVVEVFDCCSCVEEDLAARKGATSSWLCCNMEGPP